MKGLFLDYDGTISSLNVTRSESTVPAKTCSFLRQISRRIPVAILSAKDLLFLIERTPFAQAWSALGGLETKTKDGIIKASCLKKVNKGVMRALKYARTFCSTDLTIGEKLDSGGEVVAFSVDWRHSKDPNETSVTASRIAAYCETLPIFTVRYENQPYFDVFPCRVDKGDALLLLKEKLGLRNGVLYMGDSILDNPAFELADVSLGVIHAETSTCLTCDYFVRFEDVADFLSTLLQNDFVFSPDLSSIIRK